MSGRYISFIALRLPQECQDRLLGSNPQRTIKVFEEHEAVTKHSDDVMDKFCDEKAELSDAAISAGLMCTEAAADFVSARGTPRLQPASASHTYSHFAYLHSIPQYPTRTRRRLIHFN